jgi:hypothetical protein
MPAIFPGFEPLGGGEACPKAGSGLGATLAVLVMVVPFSVTVITEGTRLGAGVGEGLDVIDDVAKLVLVGDGVGFGSDVVSTEAESDSRGVDGA